MQWQQQLDLQHLNTFHIQAFATEYAYIETLTDITEAIQYAQKKQHSLRILGGGSNVLLTQDIKDLLLINRLRGIELVYEDQEVIDLQCMSGEAWHDCVMWAVQRGYGGIENLSLIPGTAGAAPIQNIGAYGVECKDVLLRLSAINLQDASLHEFTAADCRFGYRDSIFKQEARNQYFIVSITLRLQKKPTYHIDYGNIREELTAQGVETLSVKAVSDAVMSIRRRKLPDPAKIGNAGSFFKNPVISQGHYQELKTKFPNMPSFVSGHEVKIPAAWLIESCGWKGFREGDYGVHTQQALCLVNYNQAKGTQILELSTRIMDAVLAQFNIQLEREVNIW